MRLFTIFCLGLVATAAVGCRKDPYSQGILQKTYVHKYGVEIPAEEWSDRGQNGEVIMVRKDGVTVTNHYVDGVLHGDVVYTYPNNTSPARKQTYEQGRLADETLYYRAGTPKQGTTYEADGLRTITQWYDSGEPQWIERWQGSQLVEGKYYTPQHNLEAEIVDGRGIRVQRDRYGALATQETFEDGQRVQLTSYYPDGIIKEIVPEDQGHTHGLKQSFSPDGSPLRSEEWSQGKRHGCTTLYEHGDLLARMTYVDGQQHGIEERFRDGHALVSRTTWRHGQRHGPCEHYIGNQVVKTEWFYQDKPVTAGNFALLSDYKSYTQPY